MSRFNPFARRQEPPAPPAPSEEEQRRQRQENARVFFAHIQQEPQSAPPPAALPVVCSPAHDLLAPVATPPLPATLDVARELERAMHNGLFNGVVREVRREADAMTQVGQQVERKLAAQRKIVDSNEQVLAAQNKLKATLFDGQIVEENKATELSRARLARVQAEQALREALCPSPPKLEGSAALPSVRITDAQIEAMALRIVMQLRMESDPAHAWEIQRAELYNTLPVNIAREVEGKVLDKQKSVA